MNILLWIPMDKMLNLALRGNSILLIDGYTSVKEEERKKFCQVSFPLSEWRITVLNGKRGAIGLQPIKSRTTKGKA